MMAQARAEAQVLEGAMVREARKGDVSAARDILHTVCASIETGKPLPEPVAKYLQRAFSAYLSGAQPAIEKALNLVLPASRPPEINARVPVRIKRLRKIRVAGRGIRTSPVAANVEGTRRQSYLVARIYLRMKLHRMEKGEALAWVSRRYRIPDDALKDYDRDLDAIRGWTVEQLESLIRLAK
jgi:hypothetical protein